MPAGERELLLTLLREPGRQRDLSPQQWDRVVRQARSANLLARLGYLLADRSEDPSLPDAVRRQLASAQRVAEAQGGDARWEVRELQRILREIGVPLILLKGAAYLIAGLPPAPGRVFIDIDILVPKASLDQVERVLGRFGWVSAHHDAYDQRYYRQWMHELPPLRHLRRETLLDVHHGILPETSRLQAMPRELLAAARPVPGLDEVYVLAPPDMVLHSAVHLFADGEFENGLRDLVDLDGLLKAFGNDPRFWPSLIERARQFGLLRPLYYALRYTRRFLATPLPDEVWAQVAAERPGALLGRVMDTLFVSALYPAHPSCDTVLTGIARWALYVRAHYLRMPWHLLLPHLARKAVRRRPGHAH